MRGGNGGPDLNTLVRGGDGRPDLKMLVRGGDGGPDLKMLLRGEMEGRFIGMLVCHEVMEKRKKLGWGWGRLGIYPYFSFFLFFNACILFLILI